VAALARLALLPAAALYRAGTWTRNAAYDVGLLSSSRLPRPSVGVGNLAVGGTGKTPMAAFLAAELRRRGVTAGIVLRGYGGDEVDEHREANPEAAVEASPDRMAAAARAVSRGAEALVLDDCLQRRDVKVDVMLALVSAATWTKRRWSLPAGPWREGRAALRRADAVVVTRKTAWPDDAAALARTLGPWARRGAGLVAALEPVSLRPVAGGTPVDLAMLAGRDVLAVAGIGEPELFATQLQRLGARVTALILPDHYAYSEADAARLGRLAEGRWIVTTAKDAVKLRSFWRTEGPPCYAVRLGVRIEAGAEALASMLDGVATAARNGHPATAASPTRES